MSFRHIFRRAVTASLLALAMLAALLPTTSPLADAQAQNELVVGIAFDGQAFTGPDPLDSHSGITPNHTAGDDERGDNGVVRTFDLVGYRLDYNVNEDDQTGVTITATLPPNMTWITAEATVDTTFPLGMFPGCRPGSSITSSGIVKTFPAPIDATVTGTNDILTCVVDDADHEGNNGTILPTAQLLLDLDGQPLTLNATLDTNEQPCNGDALCSGSAEVESSAAPQANFRKGQEIGNSDPPVLGANEWFPMQRNGVDGWVSIWHITFNSLVSGGIGGTPLNDGFPISFYDHYWDFTPNTVLATTTGDLSGTSIIPGRAACGALDTSPAPATAGTWTCSDVAPGTVKLDLTGYDTDGSPSPHSTAQVAIWSPLSELQTKSPRVLVNTISQSATPPAARNTAAPIEFGSVTGDPPAAVAVPESTVADNDAAFTYALLVGGGDGARDHNAFFLAGPYQMRENMRDGGIGRGIDFRRENRGGLNGIRAGDNPWVGDQETPRGNIVTLTTQHTTDANITQPIHSCVHFDNTHINVVPMPATFPVFDIGTGFSIASSTIGGYTDSPSHGFANVIVSERARFLGNFGGGPMHGIDQLPDSYAVVEFATATTPVRQIDTPTTVTSPASLAEDGLTCNNDDAVGQTWIDSTDTAALAAAFDADGDGRYQGIDLIRVRMLESGLWESDTVSNRGLTLEASVQLQVLDDVAVDVAGSEIFAYASRAAGEWDPSTQNRPPETGCHALENAANSVTTTGWCNNMYDEDTNVGFGVPGGALWYDNEASEKFRQGLPTMSHADKLTIVEANIGINKFNLDGLTDIADNGDTVTFGIDVFTVGATVDILEDIVLTDPLPSPYGFVQITQQPSTPGASCTGGQTITCTFGDHPGGWSDYVEIEVVVQNTAANTQTVNTATLTANRDGEELSKESFAYSRASQPFEEAAIVKAVNTIAGDCENYPAAAVDVPLAPEPADWADRCELTDYDTGELNFTLELFNEGNTTIEDLVFVDVFPHLGDEVETASATGVVGDGRAPESDFAGNVSFVDFTGGGVVGYWVTGDAPGGVSRDPENAITDTTWCSWPGGAVQNLTELNSTVPPTPANGCPAAAADITAIYAQMAPVRPDRSVTGVLELVSEGHECNDIWTNTFGARHPDTLLPIRSNDVSIMVHCMTDPPAIDIEKDTNGVQSDEAPGEEIVAGESVKWTYEVTNTGGTALANATVTDSQGVTVSCDIDGDGVMDGTNVIPFLLPGDSVTCEGEGTAQVGPYQNNSTVVGDPLVPDFFNCDCVPDDPSTWPTDPADFVEAVDDSGEAYGPVDDEDPSHYTGIAPPTPAIDIEKDTNGAQSDEAPGENIKAGDPVTWTYVVTNTGGTALANATVTDNQGVTVSCDLDGDGAMDGTNVIPFLLPGESVTCEGEGIAQVGPYENVADVSGAPLTPDFNSCSCDPNDPSTWPTDPDEFGPALDASGEELDPVIDDDPSHYTGVSLLPAIDIEKDTNGVQSDEAPGELIPAGDPITWTYVVTNTGGTALADATVTDSQGVTVSCDIDGDGAMDGTNVIPFLAVGASVTCEGYGVAQDGPYENNSTVVGDPVLPDFATCGCDPADPTTWPTDPADFGGATGPDGLPLGPVDDADPSHYTGQSPEAAIDIEKDTNGVQSDEAPGENIKAGDPVTWTYVVTNTGSTALANSTVTDSQGVTVSCDIDGDGAMDGTNIIPFLAVGASVTCEGEGIAQAGPYENNSTVVGDPVLPDFATCGCDPNDPSTWPTDPADYDRALGADGLPLPAVDDEDPSHYTGVPLIPAIDIEKDTNGVQSDEAPGELIPAGSPVTWTYVVTNTGGTALANSTVTDSQGVTVSCDIDGDGVMDGTNIIPFLAVGASVTCEGTGIAQVGPYMNDSSVVGDPVLPDFATCGCDPADPATWPTDPADFGGATGPDGLPLGPVDDADPSHYTGQAPTAAIDIEKDTNGVQSDEAPGETIPFGDPVTWTYVVTNTGITALANSTVTDSQGVTVSCDIDGDGVMDGTNVIPFLLPGDSVTCEGTGIAQVGPYMNDSSVVGDPITPDYATCGCDPQDPSTWPTDPAAYGPAIGDDGQPLGPVDDADPSHYTGLAPIFDLALKKTLAEGQPSTVTLGDTVTFTIEIINQGEVDAIDISIIDYLPDTMTLADSDWTSTTDGNASIDLPGPLLAGTSMFVDITVTLNSVGDFSNTAEITQATAVDANGLAITNPDGSLLADIDSIPDANDDDPLTDDITDGTGNDEDDHDIAQIIVTSGRLAFTGAESARLWTIGIILTAAGALLVLPGQTRRRRESDPAGQPR